ncbi:MAG TPA: DUF1254 domain-containing protein [Fontimonas sp.]
MSWRGHLLLFVLLVPLFNTLAVLALPQAVNAFVMHRIARQALAEAAIPSGDPRVQAHKQLILERRAINVSLPAQLPDASARIVVRPSPDLLYTACLFDVSEGPLHITAALPDSYLSVSGFGAETSNFFALNDRDAWSVDGAPGLLDITLAMTPARGTEPGTTRHIQAPSPRGLVLFRMLVQDRAPDAALLALRAQQRCEPLR